MSGGLYPSGKVASLSSRNQGIVLVPSSIMVNITRNPETLGSVAVSANPEMMLQVRCTGARLG